MFITTNLRLISMHMMAAIISCKKAGLFLVDLVVRLSACSKSRCRHFKMSIQLSSNTLVIHFFII